MIPSLAQLLRRYSHVNWALADQAVLSGVNFLTGVLLARHLGIEEFGRFSLAWVVIASVTSIQGALIISPMMSIGPKQATDELSSYYCTVVWQQLLLSALAFAAILVGVRSVSVLRPEWELDLLAFPLAGVALATQWQEFLRRYFFTRNRRVAAFINDIVRYVSQLILLLLLFGYYETFSATETVLWVIAGSAALSFYGFLLIERLHWDSASARKVLTRHWQFSKWLIASVVMRFTVGNLGLVLLGVLLGTAVVGSLRAAQSLMGISHILFFGLENFVPIRAAQRFQESGRSALFNYLRRVSIFGGVVTAALAFVAAIAPNLWLTLVFGDQYKVYGFVLQWVAITYLVDFFVVPLSAGLRAMERTSHIFYTEVCLTVATLTCAYPLIKFLGLPGLLGGNFLVSLVIVFILMSGLRKPSP